MAAVCIVLVLAVLAVFGQTAGFEFVDYDDNIYVYENPVVAKGLTLKGAVWALTYGEIGHWHPLTWLTHMADCQVYGLWAGGHHLTNVALHAAAAVLLFLALREMTGSLWRSAFVAAVFAIHPLRVESVAWIAERKDVLSGVFFMLTLWAYARYAGQPSRWRYAAVALAYALGLLCKNTLVTLPFVLLLLDWWPLHRVKLDGGRRREGWRRETCGLFGGLVKEKIPLFLLSVGSCVATALVPEKVLDSDRLPFLERIGNALVSYGIYLRQMVFPAGLAIPYPNPPHGLPFWEVALAFVLLAAISISVLACRNKTPVPAGGLALVSGNAGSGDWDYSNIVLCPCGSLHLFAWNRAGPGGDMGGGGLEHGVETSAGGAGRFDGRRDWRIDGLRLETDRVLEKQRNLVDPHARLHHRQLRGPLQPRHTLFTRREGWTKRSPISKRHWKSSRDNAEAHNNLGIALLQKGKVDEAIAQYQKALQIKPYYRGSPHTTSAIALQQKGRMDEAITHYQQALEIKPDDDAAHFNLGNALRQKGRVDEAITHYQKALQIKPADMEAQNNLAWLLATAPQASLRNGDKAVQLARQANGLAGGENPVILRTLAAAFAETGRFGDAVQSAQKAIEAARAAGRQDLAAKLNGELHHYQAGLPLHQ